MLHLTSAAKKICMQRFLHGTTTKFNSSFVISTMFTITGKKEFQWGFCWREVLYLHASVYLKKACILVAPYLGRSLISER